MRHLLAADEQREVARARGDRLPRAVDARAPRGACLVDPCGVGRQGVEVVGDSVGDPRLALELAAGHVRYVEMIEVVAVDSGVGQTVLAGLREQLADPALTLAELGHRRADDRNAIHTRLLTATRFTDFPSDRLSVDLTRPRPYRRL